MRSLIVWLALAHGVASAGTFTTMDRQDGDSALGFEASFVDDNGLGGDLARFDLHGQDVGRSGFGLYGALPFATLSGPRGAVTVGDAEIGGIFIPRLRRGNFTLVFHAGLSVPTGTNGADNIIEKQASGARIADFYLSLPRATSLRFGGSPIVRSGNIVFRGDFGVDVNLDVDNRGEANTVLRLDGAIGVLLGNAVLSGEFTNTFDTGRGNGWIDTAALALRLYPRSVHPYVAVVFPLDHDARNLFGVAFTLGIDIPL